MRRRNFLQLSLQLLGASAATAMMGSLAACAIQAKPRTSSKARPQVVVVGGGFAGATAAKYIRLWSEQTIDVTLVEPHTHFISGPVSNLVLSGVKSMADITFNYDRLTQRHGVNWIQASAQHIDPVQRTVQLNTGQRLPYDRLIVAPGIDFMWEQIPALQNVAARDQVVHAWLPGRQTIQLQQQLAAMADGQTFVITVPLAPYRCPPGPYERACQVAYYFKRYRKKSKVLILDANDHVVSKGALFKAVWQQEYAGIVEYQPQFTVADIDLKSRTVISDFGDKVSAGVLNVIPAQRAGALAQQTGLANINQRWCEVDFLTYESTQLKNIHVLGDAIQAAQQMPKSGHMANQQAKVCAAAIIDLLGGQSPNAAPLINNTCYSYVSDHEAMHVASVHTYNAEQKTMSHIAGGLSPKPSALEAEYAWGWAQNIWSDVLG